jgi:N-acetylglucosamine malate deacetylase 1
MTVDNLEIKNEGKKKILVIAAHPDDEILGVGGTILKHVENGDEVHVCIVTSGFPPDWSEEFIRTKREEAKKVDSCLGITKRYYCELPAAKLNTIAHGELNKKILAIVEEVNPDTVYTHYENDIHKDHRIIYESVMVSTRPIKDKKIRVLCFETVSSSEWNLPQFTPNYYINITKFIHKKIDAFLEYKSEIKQFPHPRSSEGLMVLAKKRGMEVNVQCAEAFKIVREFW